MAEAARVGAVKAAAVRAEGVGAAATNPAPAPAVTVYVPDVEKKCPISRGHLATRLVAQSAALK